MRCVVLLVACFGCIWFGGALSLSAQTTGSRTARVGVRKATSQARKITRRTMGSLQRLASRRVVGRRITRLGETADRREERMLEARRKRRRQATPQREKPESRTVNNVRSRWRKF